MNLYKQFPIQLGVTHHRILTLYDLIKAVQEEVRPEDDDLVTDVVIGSLKSGRVKFLNPRRQPAKVTA